MDLVRQYVEKFSKEKYKYIFFCDLETTGLDPIRNDVIEIKFIVCQRGSKAIIDEFHSYVRPDPAECAWSVEAQLKAHGFTRVEASKFPERRKVCLSLLHWLKEYVDPNFIKQLFVYHATEELKVSKGGYLNPGRFDYNFLWAMFFKERLQFSLDKIFSAKMCFSTISMGRLLGFKGNKLNVWAERIGFELRHHEADSDTYGCYYVYNYEMEYFHQNRLAAS